MSVLDELLGNPEEGNGVKSPSGGAVIPPAKEVAPPVGRTSSSSATETMERVRTISPVTTTDTKPLTTTTTKIKRYIPSVGAGATVPNVEQTAGHSASTPATTTKAVESSGTEVRKPIEQGAVGAKGEHFLDVLKRYGATPPTPEQVEAERKRQRNRERIAAIGDAISSIANLYHTTNYAPNAYDPKANALGAVRAHGDRERAIQDRDRDAYLQHYMRALQLDRDRDDRERSWQHRQELDKIANERARAEAARRQRYDEYQQTIKEQDRGLAEKKLEETVRTNKAREANARQANAISGARLALDRKRYYDSQDNTEKVYLGGQVGYKEIDTDGIPHVYEALPDRYKEMFSHYDPKTRTYKAPSTKKMLEAVRYVASHEPEVAQRVLNVGEGKDMQITGLRPAPRAFQQGGRKRSVSKRSGMIKPQVRRNMPYLGKRENSGGNNTGNNTSATDKELAPWMKR